MPVLRASVVQHLNKLVAKRTGLLCSLTSGVLLVPAAFAAALFSTMMGPTSLWGWVAALIFAALPILLTTSLISGLLCYRSPSLARLLAAASPLAMVLAFLSI